jgi:hypothetical protein
MIGNGMSRSGRTALAKAERYDAEAEVIRFERWDGNRQWEAGGHSNGRGDRMRRIIVLLAFIFVIFMCLTSLGVFGQSFADFVRYLIRG